MPTELTRRDWLLAAAGAVAAAGLAASRAGDRPAWLAGSEATIPGEILGAGARTGHRLRDGRFPAPDSVLETEIAIVGGGVAGLSAAWWLRRAGVEDFRLLELEPETGGNARSGVNGVSAYPWGAHYVPIPAEDSRLVLELFEELGVIKGRDARGRPIYDELYLSQDPQERVFARGRWQTGQLPESELTADDHRQLAEFQGAMDRFRAGRGADGRRLFAIPVDASSTERSVRALDRVSMAHWLRDRGWDSPRLRGYVDYCCRDDYGADASLVSAWAGIHYFASRDGSGANTVKGNVLTWPEGNGWLAHRLRAPLGERAVTSALAFDVAPEAGGGGARVDYLDPRTGRATRVRARAVIFAAPRFVAGHAIAPLREARPAYLDSLEYSPWMVANLTVRRPGERPGDAPLSWDNLIHGSRSLGYVNAANQRIERYPRDTVLTYYRPLDDVPPRAAREAALARTHRSWCNEILDDLAVAHPDLRERLARIDVWLWGHGMIRPSVGYVWGEARRAMSASIGPIHFAHSDMSGISIFEEAQYRGVRAAQAALRTLGRATPQWRFAGAGA